MVGLGKCRCRHLDPDSRVGYRVILINIYTFITIKRMYSVQAVGACELFAAIFAFPSRLLLYLT